MVDDIEMGVSHIIRGEDHLTNSAAQIEMFESLGAKPPHFAHHNLLTLPGGEGMSKRLSHLSLQALRAAGYEPLAVASAAVLVGTADPVEPVASLDALASRIDFARISHGPARFDPTDLEMLTARTLHMMPFESAASRLEALKIGGGRPFWEAVRGNLSRLEEAALWWRVVNDALALAPALPAADLEICKRAAEVLPPEPWDAATWEKANWNSFVESTKRATGKSGRALFHPLRLALTGEERGPELRALLPFIGRARATARLQGQRA